MMLSLRTATAAILLALPLGAATTGCRPTPASPRQSEEPSVPAEEQAASDETSASSAAEAPPDLTTRFQGDTSGRHPLLRGSMAEFMPLPQEALATLPQGGQRGFSLLVPVYRPDSRRMCWQLFWPDQTLTDFEGLVAHLDIQAGEARDPRRFEWRLDGNPSVEVVLRPQEQTGFPWIYFEACREWSAGEEPLSFASWLSLGPAWRPASTLSAVEGHHIYAMAISEELGPNGDTGLGMSLFVNFPEPPTDGDFDAWVEAQGWQRNVGRWENPRQTQRIDGHCWQLVIHDDPPSLELERLPAVNEPEHCP